MNCPHCGHPVSDTASFCGSCGQAIAGQAAPAQAAPQQAAPAQQAYAPRPAGPLARGWHDIFSNPQWFKTMFLTFLMNLTPVTSWAARGRMLAFGAGATGTEAVAENSRGMNPGGYDRKAFGLGVVDFIFVLSVPVMLAAFNSLFSIFPYIGFVFAGVAVFLWTLYRRLLVMRVAVTGEWTSCLDFSLTFKAARRNFGSFFGAVFVPVICETLVVLCIMGLLFAVATAVAVNAASSSFGNLSALKSLGSISSSSSSTDLSNAFFEMLGPIGALFATIRQVLGVAGFLVALNALFTSFVDVFFSFWCYRSIGHWIADFAPDWAKKRA